MNTLKNFLLSLAILTYPVYGLSANWITIGDLREEANWEIDYDSIGNAGIRPQVDIRLIFTSTGFNSAFLPRVKQIVFTWEVDCNENNHLLKNKIVLDEAGKIISRAPLNFDESSSKKNIDYLSGFLCTIQKNNIKTASLKITSTQWNEIKSRFPDKGTVFLGYDFNSYQNKILYDIKVEFLVQPASTNLPAKRAFIKSMVDCETNFGTDLLQTYFDSSNKIIGTSIIKIDGKRTSQTPLQENLSKLKAICDKSTASRMSNLPESIAQPNPNNLMVDTLTVSATSRIDGIKPIDTAKLDSLKTSDIATYQNKKALIIGNDTYKSIGKLFNAREDAKAMASNLAYYGYQVTLKLDLSEKEMKAALRAFSGQVQGGDEVMFFFSGHGVQLGSTNYLLPVDIAGESEAQIRDESIQLQRILDDMSDRKAKFTLAMVDACRDNPFKSNGRAIGGRGLAPTTAATGQMIIFSAGSGQQALDRLSDSDQNKNGLFTRVLIQEMQLPGLSIDRVVKNVRNKVAELAKSVGHDQVPAIYDQVLGDFYFRR
jgi:hypothetical protein